MAGIRRGLLDETVEVQCDGGSAVVRWSGSGAVFLEGPVETIFHGTTHE